MDALPKLKNKASADHERWGQARGARAELQRRQEALRVQADEFEAEGRAFELLPESERPTPDPDHAARRSSIDAELARLEQLETDAELAKNESAARLQVEVKRQFPAKISAVQEANADVRKHLAAMGEAALKLYLQYDRARAILAQADADLAALGAQLGGDRRAKNRQQNEVKSLLDAGLTDANDLEILGQSGVNMVDWTRLASSPLENFWTERGLPTLPGSVMWGGPDVTGLLDLRDRRFRRRAS